MGLPFGFAELQDLKQGLGNKLEAATEEIRKLNRNIETLIEALRENTRSR